MNNNYYAVVSFIDAVIREYDNDNQMRVQVKYVDSNNFTVARKLNDDFDFDIFGDPSIDEVKVICSDGTEKIFH